MKRFKPAIVITATLLAIGSSIVQTAVAQTVGRSCWRMINNQSTIAGHAGLGMDWKLLGRCEVTLNSDGLPTRIQVISPPMDLRVIPYPNSNSVGLKPYQNPTGVWVHGFWESSSKRSAVFATLPFE